MNGIIIKQNQHSIKLCIYTNQYPKYDNNEFFKQTKLKHIPSDKSENTQNICLYKRIEDYNLIV